MDRSGPIPSGPYIGRSSSTRAPQTQSRGGSRGGLRGFFTNLGASSRKTNVDVSDLDPRTFPSSSAKQPRIDDAWGKTKKWELEKTISKWFHFSQIPANAANNSYYRTMVSTIQKRCLHLEADEGGDREEWTLELCSNYNRQRSQFQKGSSLCRLNDERYRCYTDGEDDGKEGTINYALHIQPHMGTRLYEKIYRRYVGTTDGKQTEKYILNTRFWDSVAEIVIAVEPLYKVLRQVDMEKTPQMGHLYHYIHQAQEEIKRVMISPTKYKSFIDIISQRWEDQMGRDIYITVERWLQFRTVAPTLRKIATRILLQTTSSSGCERNWSTFALIHTKLRNRLSYANKEVSESTYSVSSTYSTDDTWSSSWNPNKETLMSMWYNGYETLCHAKISKYGH
ncbi:hypothetical protein Cni_G20539 [Canna indica]|uniref:HAT C-terminal dimerisation domain-containing protein n=1 Tax=Canna indica TaxID=4628 RepID=A0AAQ3QKV3_9LILI|nr:hypothetical protein Cni_G20539 [Canna indica]